MHLRVMTFNIQHGNVNLADYIDLDKMCQIIRSVNPDVVALQEVYGCGPWKELTAQAETMAAALGMHCFYGRSIFISGENPYGNAILSKYPIVEAQVIDIPDPVGASVEHRTICRCVIDLYGKRLAVYGTHYGLRPPEHEHAVSTTLATVKREALPLVFMGDLNMTPDNPLILALNEHMQSTDPLLSGKLTFPAEAPNRKIDYIFTSDGIEVTAADVIEQMASDHFPVCADIIL